MATEFGATHTVDAARGDPVEAIRGLTGGNGADVCIEAVGHPKVMEQAFWPGTWPGHWSRSACRPRHAHRPADDRVLRAWRRLKPSWYGDCLPVAGLPDARRPYLAGPARPRPLRVSETIGIEQVEEAFARMQRGEVLRSVVVL